MGDKRHQHPPALAGGLGKVLIISSGETSASAHDMFEHVFTGLKPPVRMAIMETPAGFELNSALVARKVGDFVKTTMKNFSPSVSIVPARRRDGPFSTNVFDRISPIVDADCIYLGAGSPTYTVGHLRETLAWGCLLARHQQGAALCLASAAAIAFGSKALPVYEIYKAGHDLHWIDGLDFFGRFGLDLAIVTHWNNQEGGVQLDTSRCFMGRSRMEKLIKMLPPTTVILGIDEYTGLVLDFENEVCHLAGKGGVALQSAGAVEVYGPGSTFPIQRLGPYHRPVKATGCGSGVEVAGEDAEEALPSPELRELLDRREDARKSRRWTEADQIRRQVSELGFEIRDTAAGPRLLRR
ncbi:MAG: cysteinyl-tRNA synthetase [Dehalococcoidia bacterium]|nr:cysteinyl-tRNA synthetase [Dehalococcoidia bacterium]